MSHMLQDRASYGSKQLWWPQTVRAASGRTETDPKFLRLPQPRREAVVKVRESCIATTIQIQKEGVKMVFWNIAGVKGKGEDTWEFLEEFDFVGLVETWVEQKDWQKVKGGLPGRGV